MKDKKIYMIIGAAVLLIYGGIYCRLRATHVVRHFSNEHHWEPEHREPGHYLRVARSEGSLDELATVVFWPLVITEKIARQVF